MATDASCFVKFQKIKAGLGEADEKLQFLQSIQELIKTSSFSEDFPPLMDFTNNLIHFIEKSKMLLERKEKEFERNEGQPKTQRNEL